MPKPDPSSAPQVTPAATAPQTPAVSTPANAASNAPQASGATSATPATAPPAVASAPADPIDVQAVALQRMEAKLTGNTKEAARLDAILAGRNSVAAADFDAGDSAAPAADVVPAAEADGEDIVAAQDVDAGDSAAAEEGDLDADVDLDAGQPSAEDTALDLPKELPNRLRVGHLSKEDRAKATAIHALTMGGMSYKEASDTILGTSRAAEVADPDLDDPTGAGSAAVQQQQHNAPPSQALADLETEVQQLEQELETAGATEGVFNTEIAKLTAKLTRATARLEAQRSNEASAAREAQRDQAAHGTQVKQSEARAFKSFPAAQDKASPLYGRFLEKCLAANHPSHPDHERSFAADAPEYFLAKAAEEMGIKPAGSNGRTVPVPPAAAVRGPAPANGAARPGNGSAAPVTRPAPGTRTSSPPPPPKTSAQLVEEKMAEREAIQTGHRPATRARLGGLITL